MKADISIVCKAHHELVVEDFHQNGPFGIRIIVKQCEDCIKQAALEERHRMVELVKDSTLEFANSLYNVVVKEKKEGELKGE